MELYHNAVQYNTEQGSIKHGPLQNLAHLTLLKDQFILWTPRTAVSYGIQVYSHTHLLLLNYQNFHNHEKKLILCIHWGLVLRCCHDPIKTVNINFSHQKILILLRCQSKYVKAITEKVITTVLFIMGSLLPIQIPDNRKLITEFDNNTHKMNYARNSTSTYFESCRLQKYHEYIRSFISLHRI